MGCCRKGRADRIRRYGRRTGARQIDTLVRGRIEARRPAVAAESLPQRTELTAVCKLVQEHGDNLPLVSNGTLLIVVVEGVRFELFSALRAQGCPAYPELERLWSKASRTKKVDSLKGLQTITPATLVRLLSR